MRVLHVVRGLRHETGGVAEAVRQLAEAQRALGDEVIIASLDPAEERQPVQNLTQAAAAQLALGTDSLGYGYSSRYVPWLRRHADEFDVVAVHGLWHYHAFGTWRVMRDTRTPYVVYPHGMLDVWFKRTYPLKHLKKWLYWPWADYRVLRDAAAVCYTAEDERTRARQSFWLYRAREYIAPIGVPPPEDQPDRQRNAFNSVCPQLRGRSFLLYLGRIHPKKAPEAVLEAYGQTGGGRDDRPYLVMAGPTAEPEYLNRLQRRAVALGIADRVIWLPMLKGDAKWGALRECEAFVLFSHQENFGVAVVEALACARPVIISNQVNIWRQIVADGAGIAVPDTIDGAARGLREWFGVSTQQRGAMGAAAKHCFASRFSAEQAARAFANVVGCLASRKIA